MTNDPNNPPPPPPPSGPPSEPSGSGDGFDDHLQANLQHQGAEIPVTVEGFEAVADRHQRRQRNTLVARVAAAVILLAGVGGFVLSRQDETATTETASEDDGGDDSPDVASDPGVTSDGPSLSMTDVSDSASPRADFWQGGVVDGVYYVISTAPASETPDFNPELATEEDWALYEDMYRPNTIYRWDGSWTHTAVNDRHISNIQTDGSILYTVSTGLRGQARDASISLALGRSDDLGSTWNWTDIDTGDTFAPVEPLDGDSDGYWPGYVDTRVAGKDGRFIVVASRSSDFMWSYAYQLMETGDVGLEPGTDEIVGADLDGFSFVRDAWTPDPNTCFGKRELFRQQLQAEAGIADLDAIWMEIEREGREPTDEEMAMIDEYSAQMDDFWRDAERQTVEYMETLDDCQAEAVCMRAEFDNQERIEEKMQALRDELGLPDESEINSEEEYRKYEDLFNEFYERADAEIWSEEESYWNSPEAQACGELIYGGGPSWSEDDVETMTWAEAGVTVPESWGANNAAYLIEGDTVTPVGSIFEGSPNYIMSLEATDTGFELMVDLTEWGHGYEATEPEYRFGTYTSSDGLNWTETISTGDPYGDGYYPGSVARLGNMTFTIGWPDEGYGEDVVLEATEEGEADETAVPDDWEDPRAFLARSIAGAEAVEFSLEELAPGYGESGYQLEGVKAGPFGVVAWAVHWDYSDEDSYENGPPPVDSILLYSADGISWGVTEMPDTAINGAIVGESNAMIGQYNPEVDYLMYEEGIDPADLPPTPIMVATVDG